MFGARMSTIPATLAFTPSRSTLWPSTLPPTLPPSRLRGTWRSERHEEPMTTVRILQSFHRYIGDPEVEERFVAGQTVEASDEDALNWMEKGLAGDTVASPAS